MGSIWIRCGRAFQIKQDFTCHCVRRAQKEIRHDRILITTTTPFQRNNHRRTGVRITKGQLRRIIREEISYAQGPIQRDPRQSQSRADALAADLRRQGHPGAHVTMLNLGPKDLHKTYAISSKHNSDGVPTQFEPVTDDRSWERPPVGTHEAVIDDDGFAYVVPDYHRVVWKFYVG